MRMILFVLFFAVAMAFFWGAIVVAADYEDWTDGVFIAALMAGSLTSLALSLINLFAPD